MPETPDPGAFESNSQESAAGDPAQPASGLHSIFLGRDGLRAGWGLLLFLILFLALLFCGGLLINKAMGAPGAVPTVSMSPKAVFLSEGLSFMAVLLATWVMARIEGRKISEYGFKPQRRLHNFCAGLAWGVAMLSLLVVLLRVAGLLVFDARLLFGRSVLGYGLLWLGGFMLVGIVEECVTRAYLQFTLTRGLSGVFRWLLGESRANALGFWTAALILSFAFGLGHKSNPGESPLGLLSAGLAGLLFCLSLWRTGSLWWAIGFHASWDWAQSFLYGVADSGLMIKGHLFATHPMGRPFLSGGLTGPEGSILLIPVLLVAAALIFITLPQTDSVYSPASTPGPSLH